MRLSLCFASQKREMPIAYHKVFISLLKSSFEIAGGEVYKKLYSEPRVKPYTFAVFFKNPVFEREKILFDGELHFHFSTCFTDIGVKFYNGIVKRTLRVKEVPVFVYKNGEVSLYLKGVKMRREKKIKGKNVIFKTLSPIIIRHHDREGRRDEYYTFEAHPEMCETQINVNMRPVFEEFLGKVYPLKIEPIEMKEVPIKVVDKKGEIKIIKGNVGTLRVSADCDEVLQFVYQVGLGAKRSYGFGMLEVEE